MSLNKVVKFFFQCFSISVTFIELHIFVTFPMLFDGVDDILFFPDDTFSVPFYRLYVIRLIVTVNFHIVLSLKEESVLLPSSFP